MMKNCLSNIIEEAELAFWAKVAELVPEAESGDLDPLIVINLKLEMRQAVERWIELNVPEVQQ